MPNARSSSCPKRGTQPWMDDMLFNQFMRKLVGKPLRNETLFTKTCEFQWHEISSRLKPSGSYNLNVIILGRVEVCFAFFYCFSGFPTNFRTNMIIERTWRWDRKCWKYSGSKKQYDHMISCLVGLWCRTFDLHHGDGEQNCGDQRVRSHDSV